MANITIAIDAALLRQARIRAAERGTSVNAVLRDYMRSWVGSDSGRERGVDTLIGLSRKVKSGRYGKRWTRDELHER